MAAAAFDSDGGGGYGLAMARRRWKLTSAVAGGNGGCQRLTAAMDEEGGCWRMTVALDGSCGSGGGGSGVRWRQQRSMALDGVSDGLRQEDERAAQGQATQQPASNERTRGWCNLRTIRDDGATTSWRDETT
jgi:hypothetical protein